ncbi:MAG: RNA pseudouridine synthase [Sideroxydans sp.]|nr:RNA pseudouridine synthase [Sideroxydans sp.]
MPAADFELVYCDAALLVANKPAGLLAVPGRGADKQDCLSARIQQTHPDALIVHRLDMATSGLLVFGRGADMQRKLSRLFHDRKVEKRYVAVVAGQMDEAGKIELPLGADWPNRPQQKVDHASGKHSLTRYRLLAHDAAADTSRLELEPVTGRTHQLRVHLAAIGHPIVGDALYGGRAAARLLLHASALSFPHPLDGSVLRLENTPLF